MNQYELNFNDYWRIVKKKKWLIIFTALMVTIFSIIFTVINTPTLIYEASASIQIEKNTSLTGLYMESVSWNYGGDLPTRAAIIKSYSLVEKAAKSLGLIDSSLTSDEIKNNKKYFSIIEGLKSRISTEQEGYTNIINISVKSHNPQLAKDLANTLAKTYQEENFHQKNSKTENAIIALEHQLSKAETDYREAEKNLQNFRQTNNLLTLEGKTNQITTEMLRVEKQIEDLNSDISQITSLIPKLKEDNDYFRYINLDLFLNNKNFSIASMQQKLNQYNTRLNEINQYYTDEHPAIKNLEQQKELIRNNIISELVVFQKSLQQLRIIAHKKLDELTKEYSTIPLQSQQIENLRRELQNTQNIYQELKVNYMQSQVKKSENIQEVFLIRPAFLPTTPINSVKLTPTALAGLIIGIIFGIILAFIAESLDTTFRTIDDIEQTLGTHVQGIIPFIDLNEVKESLLQKDETEIPISVLQQRSQLMTHFSPKSTVAESYRSLRTNINFSLLEKNLKTIMITSSVASEGKTNVAMNLSISMAQTGLKTLLVETDLRKPRVSKSFGIERTPGLTDYILNREPLENCIRNMSDIMMGLLGHDALNANSIPGIEYLNILPAGKIERNPSEIIAGKRLDELIKLLKEEYDIIIFDSAPIIQATDAVVLSSKVDTNLILYYQGKISRNTLRRALNQLQMLKSNVLGIVINGMKADITADYIDYKYKYDYLYSYGELNTDDKPGILSKIQSAFIEEKNISHFSLLKRLKKLPIMLAFLLIAIITILYFSYFNENSSLPQDEQYIDNSSPQKIEETTPVTTNQTPKELKEIQKSLNITPEVKVQNSIKKNHTSDRLITKEESTTPNINLNLPYTIQIMESKNKEECQVKLGQLKQLDLNAFMTVDYSDPNIKKYLVCLDLFQSKDQVQSAITQLKSLNLVKSFVIKNLPYSLIINQNDYIDKNEYQFTIYSDATNNKYYFAGAFTNEMTATIFKKTNSSFNNFKIVKR